MKRKLMFVLASVVLATSCSNDDFDSLRQSSDNIVFTASMKTIARATETAFDEGDKIGVYAVSAQENVAAQLLPNGNYADNVCYTYDGSKFVNAQGIVHPTDGSLRYYAIYPYLALNNANFRFIVKTSQNASGQYTLSDLCTAVTDNTSDKEVNLSFSHRLSHIVINLQGEALGTGMPIVKLNNVNTGCDVNLNANTFTDYESRNTVYCAENGTNSYKAIIVPQTIKSGNPFIIVNLNGKEYTLKAASDIYLASGKQREFNLAIEKDEIVCLSGEILPWEEEADSEQSVNIYVAGMFDGLWDGLSPCLWVNGEEKNLPYEMGSYGFATTLAVSGSDVYVGGTTNAPLSSGAEDYSETATIWKNGEYFYGGHTYSLGYGSDYCYVYDLEASGDDVFAVIGSCERIWKNGEFMPYRYANKDSQDWPYMVRVDNGNMYVLCRSTSDYRIYKYHIYNNEELLDYEIEDQVCQFYVKNNDIYCLIYKDKEYHLWKNGEIIPTGLTGCVNYGLGSNFKTMYIDGNDVYIIGHQNGIAKVWKNGEVSLLTDETNRLCITGIHVHNSDVYVVGYEDVDNFETEFPPYQYSIIKLWKNGVESVMDTCYYLSVPCSIVVTSSND